MKLRKIIIILEDDPGIRDLLSQLFSEFSGYRCLSLTPEQALKYISQHLNEKFLIFVDLVMPGMTGWEFLSLVKPFKISVEMKVVAITGLDQRRWGTAVEDADQILLKPFQIEELLKMADAFFSPIRKVV